MAADHIQLALLQLSSLLCALVLQTLPPGKCIDSRVIDEINDTPSIAGHAPSIVGGSSDLLTSV